MKRVDQMLNIVIGAVAGAFVGHAGCLAWDFHAHPEWYAVRSAPWYISIQLWGVVALIVVAVCLAVKWWIHGRR